MARTKRRLPAKLLAYGITLTLLAIAADSADLLDVPENWLYDARAKHCQYFAPPPSPDIVHLDIDDGSLEAVGQWPWPRAVMADMVDEIRLASPKAVLFDILFIDPARPEWKPETAADGSTHFVKIDNDAILASSMKRLGDALLPVNLEIVEPPAATPIELEMRKFLEKDLEHDESEMARLFPASGMSNTGWLAAFLSARRYVVNERISEVWDRINPTGSIDAADLIEAPAHATTAPSVPSTQPGGATQPATAPSTQPAAGSDLVMSLPLAGPLERKIILQLLPHTDLSVNSALLRTVDDQFRQVRNARILRRLSFPIPPNLPHLFRPTVAALPVPELAAAAAAVAFVDYPTFRDGKVRAVPLMVQYDGRMYPQIGLMLASMMLGVSPAEFRCTPDTITIPMAGRPDGKGGIWKHDINIPIRTFFSPSIKQPIPTYFDIPWYGGKKWEAMYDPAHPRIQKQHLSINVVHDVCETRRRIEIVNRKIDNFLHIIFDATREASIQAFLDHPPPPSEPLSRRAIVASTMKVLTDLGIPLDKSPDDKDITDDWERVVLRAIKALREADQDSVSLADQLGKQRDFLRAQLRDKGVLIGAVATGMDLKATSIHTDAPGIVVHGTIANAILTGRLWRTAPDWVTLLVILVAGLLTTGIVAALTPPLAMVSSLGLAVVYILVNGLVVFDYGNVIVGLAGPLIAIAAVWSVCTLSKLITERRERTRITQRFSTYVDPSLVDWVIKHPEQARFDGEMREMSMVFSDLVGFTTLTEKMGEKAIPVLNEYMGHMIPTIRAHRGFIGCLMGDGIYFFFGAPEPNPNHALNAVQSVCAMYSKLDELNVSLLKRGLPTLGMRVGVTTGKVIVGDAGCPPVRGDYTALGDSVNLAARLESANKVFGTNSLISDRTTELLNGSFLIRPVAKLRVKGKQEAVAVYEALCTTETATPEKRRIVECTETMVTTFQQARFDECIAAADRLEREMEHSRKLAGVYRELARKHIVELPAEFDGGVTLTEK